MIKVYTSATCPKCMVLKTKLKQKGIEFEEIRDLSFLEKQGILTIPQLQVNSLPLMEFKQAIEWINEQEGKSLL